MNYHNLRKSCDRLSVILDLPNWETLSIPVLGLIGLTHQHWLL
ncbi:hypothetical protein [Phormidium pseudopriestleyi]|nr:hypothetical protein [Phormidium pseudopriestleyi]